MLSVLGVEEVEKRIGDVPGVESVTVNYAAESATVRYDETQLEIGDVKAVVRQRGFESAAPADASTDASHEDHTAQGVPPTTHESAAPDAAPAGDEQQDKAAPDKG
jgi:copper chaperone CopZ